MLLLLAAALAAEPAVPNSLLDRVVARAGDPYREPGLAFTFVAGDTSRAHRWDIPGQKAEVRWTDKEGRACVAVVPVPYAGDDPVLKQAWALFTNDQYWLLAPSKWKDPGTRVETRDNALVVSFEGVGLTPKDRYVATIDPVTADVTGWEYTLESGRTGAWAWAPPTAVGGLHLSLERTSPERTIRFTGVISAPVALGAPGGTCG
ncbi:MAG: hypothetical protein Q8P18_06975 [Pseudomonadota bacterium]|nr:hypothetical protein [Pseudomonadota bacterium]